MVNSLKSHSQFLEDLRSLFPVCGGLLLNTLMTLTVRILYYKLSSFSKINSMQHVNHSHNIHLPYYKTSKSTKFPKLYKKYSSNRNINTLLKLNNLSFLLRISLMNSNTNIKLMSKFDSFFYFYLLSFYV